MKQLKLPETIDVLGHSLSVKFEKDLSHTSGNVARFDVRRGEIVIDADTNPTEKISSFLHEILEALNYYLALKLGHDDQLVPLETGLFQVLHSNGLLRVYVDE